MPSDWTHFPCTDEVRWRYLDDGHIEVEGGGVPLTRRWVPAVNQLASYIHDAAGATGTPEHWLAGITILESGGNVRACSPCSACPGMKDCAQCCAFGAMQLTLGTARTVAAGLGLPAPSAQDLFDPALNIRLGATYFASLLKRYGGDYVSAAVGYNAGSVRCAEGRTCKSFWGVCTDGSPYPLWAIQGANAALNNGFSPTIPPPPLDLPVPPRGSPWVVAASTAGGAFLAYMATKRVMRPTGRRRPAYA